MKIITAPSPSPLYALVRFFLSVRYWLWGGIIDAYNLSKVAEKRNLNYSGFHIPFLTMLIGALLISPIELLTPLSHFMRFFMPQWVWGVMLLTLGRFGIYAVLHGNCRVKCWSTGILTGCWVFLTVITFRESGISMGGLVFAYVVTRCAALMKNACKPSCP